MNDNIKRLKELIDSHNNIFELFLRIVSIGNKSWERIYNIVFNNFVRNPTFFEL